MSGLRRLEFEAFPPELRLRIYRRLLVNEDTNREFDKRCSKANEQLPAVNCSEADNKDDDYEKNDDEHGDGNIPGSDGEYRSIDLNDAEGEDDEDSRRGEKGQAESIEDDGYYSKDTVTEPRDWDKFRSTCVYFRPWGNFDFHPEIMRTNKLIHREAADVLYGENIFEAALMGYQSGRIRWEWEWRRPLKSGVPRQYENLISKMFMCLYMIDPEALESYSDPVMSFTKEQHGEVCAFLAVNDFRQFHVECSSITMGSFRNRLGVGKEHSEKPYLEPLKTIRAAKVSFQV